MDLAWEPIAELPDDWRNLSDGELGPLLQFWNDQRVDLEQSGALKTFTERLGREWSIETGQIEGVYDLDFGITQTLIERGIDADLIPRQPGQKAPELVAAIIEDHAAVLDGLFQFVKGERPVSKSYIHELHSALLQHQDTTLVMDQFGKFFEAQMLKGRYKQQPNNPKKPDGGIHQYCPPEQVDSEMERLLAWHAEHEKKNVPVEIETAWLHHRFTQIHPYQDGNGRVARALASLLFIKAGWFPVVVTREDRRQYIDALEEADDDDLGLLVRFFADLQKQALFETMQAVPDAQPVHNVGEAIRDVKRTLTRSLKNAGAKRWQVTKEAADRLMLLTEKRLAEVASTLESEISQEKPDFRVDTRRRSTFILGGLFPYKPNTTDYQQVREIGILTKEKGELRQQASIELHAHAIGSKFNGLIGIVVIFRGFAREYTGAAIPRTRLLSFASKKPFQVNYAEPYKSAERRFRPWLEESLVHALTLWRNNL